MLVIEVISSSFLWKSSNLPLPNNFRYKNLRLSNILWNHIRLPWLILLLWVEIKQFWEFPSQQKKISHKIMLVIEVLSSSLLWKSSNIPLPNNFSYENLPLSNILWNHIQFPWLILILWVESRKFPCQQKVFILNRRDFQTKYCW